MTNCTHVVWDPEAPPVISYSFSDCRLLDDLVAFYPLNETSGAALDAHTGGYDLTPYLNPGSDTGHVYPLARDYTSNPYHSSDGCETPFRAGNNDFTWAGWVNMTSIAANCKLLGKYQGPAQLEYFIAFLQTTKVFYFQKVAPDGIHQCAVLANSFGAVSADTWYFVAAWHDYLNDTINIQVNNGAVDSETCTYLGVNSSDGNLEIGAYDGGTQPLNGRLQCWGFWKSTPGGGGALTSFQRACLWNNGDGLAY